MNAQRSSLNLPNIFGRSAERSGHAPAVAPPSAKKVRAKAHREKSRLFTGIDIGTTKVCAIIGRAETDGTINVLGWGSCPSRGMQRGCVKDISQTVEAVRKAYDQAVDLAHVRPRQVLVGIAGDHIQGLPLEGSIEVANPEAGIDARDVNKVRKRALKLILPQDVEVLHDFVKEYIVNDQDGISDPVGLFGHRLQVKMHVVVSSTHAANNIFRCMSKTNLKTSSVVLQSLASSLSVLSARERELGVVLIDIGGGTSDIAIFHNKNLQAISEIAMGGDIITHDIAKVLRCTTHDAENLKKKFGHAVPLEVDADEQIELPALGGSRKRRMQSRRELAEIIEARVEEICFDIRRQIELSGVSERIYAGVVLTGGTALLEGIDAVAERIMGFPCRIGRPQGVIGMNSVINSPIYSTGVGLLKWAVEEGPGFQRESWFLRKIKEVFDIYG